MSMLARVRFAPPRSSTSRVSVSISSRDFTASVTGSDGAATASAACRRAPVNANRDERGTFDEERHFGSSRIGKAQILQRRPQGVECRWRQRNSDESRRGNLNQLSLLPFAERRRERMAGNEACEEQPRNVTAQAAKGIC